MVTVNLILANSVTSIQFDRVEPVEATGRPVEVSHAIKGNGKSEGGCDGVGVKVPETASLSISDL